MGDVSISRLIAKLKIARTSSADRICATLWSRSVFLRRRRPDLPRAYRVPFSPVVPIVSALLCLYLMLNLTTLTWVRFAVWLVVGVAIYFAYGRSHSRVGLRERGL